MRYCTPTQSCHGDALIRKYRELYPGANDRNDPTQRAPTADELNLLARHRQEPVTRVRQPTRVSRRRTQEG